MDVVKAVETYVNKLVSTPVSMKVLLLDSHTVHDKLIWFTRMILIPFVFLDTHCFPRLYTVYFALLPSVPNGSNRQHETGSHASHEVCLFSSKQ